MATPPPKAPARGWFSRHWKWVVPVSLVAFLGMLLAGIALIITFVFGMIRGSEPYQHAVQVARQHESVVAFLGEPIEEGFLVSGRIHLHNQDGEAHLRCPLHGPKGKGVVALDATRHNGRWTYERLEFIPSDGEVVPLSSPERTTGPGRLP